MSWDERAMSWRSTARSQRRRAEQHCMKQATRASGRREVDDAREELAVFAVRAAVEVGVAIGGEGVVDGGPVLGVQETLRRRQDDAFLPAEVLPQERRVTGHPFLERERGLHSGGALGGRQGLDLPLERVDEHVIARVLALELVELRMAAGGALAQAPEQLLFF